MLRMIGGFPLSTGHLALLSCISKATPKAIPPDNGSLISHQKGWWGPQPLHRALFELCLKIGYKISARFITFPFQVAHNCWVYTLQNGTLAVSGIPGCSPFEIAPWRWRHRCFATVSFVRSKYGCAQWWVDATVPGWVVPRGENDHA